MAAWAVGGGLAAGVGCGASPVRSSEVFHPTYVFAINREGEEFKCRRFVELLAEHGIEVNVISGERRGDSFACPRSSAE